MRPGLHVRRARESERERERERNGLTEIVSRWDRIWLFVGLNLTAAALFLLCFTLLPVLSLRPRKFAILYHHPSSHRSSDITDHRQMVGGVGLVPGLMGRHDGSGGIRSVFPLKKASKRLTRLGRHLVSPDRWPFTATYLASIALTLYFALGVSLSFDLHTNPPPHTNPNPLAPQHPPHPRLLPRPTRRCHLVSRQLLSPGVPRFALPRPLWRLAHGLLSSHINIMYSLSLVSSQ